MYAYPLATVRAADRRSCCADCVLFSRAGCARRGIRPHVQQGEQATCRAARPRPRMRSQPPQMAANLHEWRQRRRQTAAAPAVRLSLSRLLSTSWGVGRYLKGLQYLLGCRGAPMTQEVLCGEPRRLWPELVALIRFVVREAAVLAVCVVLCVVLCVSCAGRMLVPHAPYVHRCTLTSVVRDRCYHRCAYQVAASRTTVLGACWSWQAQWAI
jgi:hypothetical protein